MFLQKYKKDKLTKHQPIPFIKEIVPEIEEKVDQALIMVENGDIPG
jgi:hypothetical protein